MTASAEPSLAGKACVVTGATGGIGRAVAHGLARRGAAVVLVGRDRERGREAVDAIRADTGNPAVDFVAADLSRQADVRALADTVRSRHPRLHLLVNNAGALYARRHESADGIEMTLALNHLAPFLLTTRLLDTLRAGAPARIVNVSSDAHRDVAAFDFADPQARRGGFGGYPRSEAASAFYALALPMAHPGFLQYARSKLATQLFTLELARRLEGSGVVANTVNPGVVVSGFGGGNGLYGWFIQRFFQRRGISVDAAAGTVLDVATGDDAGAASGRYFAAGGAVAATAAAQDRDAAARLWQLSEELTRG